MNQTNACVHINLFGAPGSGKSTMRAKLFYDLKVTGIKVEEITEYAKELTYGNDTTKLKDQLLIFGIQQHRHFVLDPLVDYIVTDSPFIMGLLYTTPKPKLKDLMLGIFNDYRNKNYLIKRSHEYQEYGRSQNKQEAETKGNEIEQFLIDNQIPFTIIQETEDILNDLRKDIKNTKG